MPDLESGRDAREDVVLPTGTTFPVKTFDLVEGPPVVLVWFFDERVSSDDPSASFELLVFNPLDFLLDAGAARRVGCRDGIHDLEMCESEVGSLEWFRMTVGRMGRVVGRRCARWGDCRGE